MIKVLLTNAVSALKSDLHMAQIMQKSDRYVIKGQNANIAE
jgi:hypothetical protein